MALLQGTSSATNPRVDQVVLGLMISRRSRGVAVDNPSARMVL